MNTQALEDIGLSKIEIKVFLSILELGESKAGKIMDKSGLQSSSVYHAINSLILKGFVSYLKKSEIKYYRASDPKAIINYIDLKKSEFLNILPELKAKQKKEEDEGVEFFKSYKGIKTLILNMIKDANKGDIYMTFSIQDSEQYEIAREKVYRPIKNIMIKKKLVMRGVFSENNRYAPNKHTVMQKRYVTTPIPPNTAILNNRIAIINWDENPSGILIHSKNLAKKYKDFFEHMWKNAKK